ncbi:lazarillo protein-like [Cydia amplana]|uniref:lazarillo protein-like n=1 Tax=Cydia amplana TaxID=1869771 RepID=UPI002FE6A110
MLAISLLLVLSVFNVDAAVQNVTCPAVSTRELDLKELDGKWYLAGAATDLPLEGDCAMVVFNHKSDNTTDVSISWINNNTISFYNGSVALMMDPNSSTGDVLQITYTDKQSQLYYFLDVNYDHYAVVFSCLDSNDGSNSSTYELWKLSRSPHLKNQDADNIGKAITSYNLQDTQFVNFNATEDTCSGGSELHPSIVITSAATLALFRRFY